MRLLVLTITALFCTSCNASMRLEADNEYARWGKETLEIIQRDHDIEGEAGYYEDQDKDAVAYAWGNSMLLQAFAEAAKFDTDYHGPLDRLMKYMDRYWIMYQDIGGYDHLPHPRNVVQRYYDDNAWIAMGQIDAYYATGKKAYLKRAERTINFCLSGIDPVSGGIWWREYWDSESQKTKNTCSVAPIAFSCLRYYEITKQESYLKKAKELMVWLDVTLKDEDSLYLDSINVSGRIDRRKWTYNSAMPLRCYVLLHQLTEEKAYLDKAVQIAAASEKRWVDASTGAIQCEAMFAFTLVEGWAELSAVTGDMHWRRLAELSVTYVHDHVKDINGRYPKRWDNENNAPIEAWNLLYPASTARAYWVLAN